MLNNALQAQIQEAQNSVTDHFNDVSYMAQLREHMFKFAKTQLRDTEVAEDLVQDALLGAVKNLKAFAGRAAFRSWVFAILKNKMVDYIRKQGRSPTIEPIDAEEFNDSGRWQQEATPMPWQCPEAGLKQEQFMVILELCLNKLPANQAQVFMMREFLGLESDEICAQAEVTESNLHVLLYRARMGLQKCLTSHWLNDNRKQVLTNSIKSHLTASDAIKNNSANMINNKG